MEKVRSVVVNGWVMVGREGESKIRWVKWWKGEMRMEIKR